jgi:hypothetical protein
MHKAEIGWTRRNDEGEKLEVFARRVGSEWFFFNRLRRFDQWQKVPHPPLEDWLELLDAVKRRAARRLLRPEEPQRIRQKIREQFPEAELGAGEEQAE